MRLGSRISTATEIVTVRLWQWVRRTPTTRAPATEDPAAGPTTAPTRPGGFDEGERTLQRQLHSSSEFMAGLAHELRGPLQGMLGIAEMLAPTETDQERRRLLQTVRRTTGHMLHVLDDSMELARMERRPEPTPSRPFRLEPVVADLFTNARPLRAEGVELCGDLARTGLLSYQGEPDRLRQILTNLVSNSLARTHSGYVQLCAHTAVDELHLSVQDTGPGIPARRQRELFDAFSRGDASPGHAGLGLAIAKRLASVSGGHLEVDSRTGEGTRFVLHMPFPPLDEPQPRHAPRRRIGIAEHCIQHRHAVTGYCERWGLGVESFDTLAEIEDWITPASGLDALVLAREWLRTPATERAFRQRCRETGIPLILLGDPEDPALPETGLLPGSIWPRPLLPGELTTALDMIDANPERIDSTRRPVLIVDDNPLVRTVLADVVADLGCIPILADNGLAAVRAAGIGAAITVVLLDRNMPGMDGLHAARMLRRQPATRDATLVLLVNDQSEAERADIGAVDRILIRPRGRTALGRALRPVLHSHDTAHAERHAPVSLPPPPEHLLENSLLEDLDRLEQALGAGAIEVVRDQVHRMRGAMRMFRATHHELWLDDLQSALRDWQKGPAPIALRDNVATVRRALARHQSGRV